MSNYIRILNAVKSNIRSLSLTASQVACCDRIEDRLAYPGVVNLYGVAGVGKTILGWAMACRDRLIYVAHPGRWVPVAANPTRPLFVDNAGADRAGFRRLLGKLEAAGVERAVIVTRKPVDDYVFRVELVLTAADVDTARSNLAELEFRSPDMHYSSLWGLLLAIVGGG